MYSRSNFRRSNSRSILRAAVENLESRQLLSNAGGWTAAGLVGEYFNNTSFASPASFSRRDVRVNFDWGTLYKPGGSTASQYAALGTDNYSIRWTGQLIPAYSETYTFIATADDSFKLEIKPTSSGTWTTVIDQASYSGSDVTGTFSFTAGQTYDVRIEYVEATGNAFAKLRWSSYSVAEEVIDPLQNNMYLVDGRGMYMMADAMDSATPTWDNAVDAYGWPTGDNGIMVWQGQSDTYFGGTYNVRFTGRAKFSADWTAGEIYIPKGTTTQYTNFLPFGVGWDSATNTTEFTMIVPSTGNSVFHIGLTSTRRLPTDTTATGITNLQMMRPQTVGGNDPYPFDAVYTNAFKQAADVFTGFRWLDTNGNLTEANWADRVKPTYGVGITNLGSGHKRWIYEYQIMFANETGKDLYITVPMRASNDYFTQLAKLIRYGSDANGTPYNAPTANPAFPPLNPNLRAYIEVSNEVWNAATGFEQTKQADDDAMAAFNAPVGSALKAEWNIINYDGSVSTSDPSGFDSVNQKRLNRWYALRTVRMSEAFRGVYGDAAMGSTVRPLMFWQYNNTFQAINEPKFLDDYFNNGDGVNHMLVPRPMSYYLWGAGGASYYGAGNPTGTLATDPIVNPSFDSGGLPLAVATPRPTIPGWSFTGNAGVYGSGGTSYTSDSKVMGALRAPAAGSYAAYAMRGGRISQNITFTASGKYAIGFTASGNTNTQYFPIDAFIDSTRVTPVYRQYDGEGGLDPATGQSPISFASNRNLPGGWVTTLSTAIFDITVPVGQPSVTLNFTIGNWDTSSASDFILFDKFFVSSADRLYDSGIPDTGEALGQVANGAWATDRKQIAQMAQAYGVQPASYESGWSLGGDNGSTPFQNYLKYRDPRSRTANNVAIDVHDRADYGLVAYGVYSQWRSREPDTPYTSQLRMSFDEKNNALPYAIDNGISVNAAGSTVLNTTNQTLSYEGSGTSWSFIRTATSNLRSREWIMWNVLIPERGKYNFAVSTGSGGTAGIYLDHALISSFTSGTTQNPQATLRPGLHTLKIRSHSGTFNINSITITKVADALPTVQSFQVNSGESQRSMVKGLTVTFSEAVTLTAGAFSLQNYSGTPIANVVLGVTNPSADQRTYLINFSGSAVAGGSVPDGMYRLVVNAANVTDSGGQPMASNAVYSFHRIFGDSDGDRDVDTIDTNAFKASLNTPGNYVWYFDYDNDLDVDDNDLLQLRARMAPPVL